MGNHIAPKREKDRVSIHPVVLFGAENSPTRTTGIVGNVTQSGRPIDRSSLDPPFSSRLNVTRFIRQPTARSRRLASRRTAIPLVNHLQRTQEAESPESIRENDPGGRPGLEENESNTLRLNYLDRRFGLFRRIHLEFFKSVS